MVEDLKGAISSSLFLFMEERRVDRVTQSRVKSSKKNLVGDGRVRGTRGKNVFMTNCLRPSSRLRVQGLGGHERLWSS